MRLLPPDTPVTDPFFAAVRRRHPDVDLVLLPAPDTPPDGSTDGSTDDPTGDRAGDLTDAAAQALRVDLAERAVRLWPGACASEPTTTLRYGSVEDAVRAVARLSGRPDDPAALVASLRTNAATTAGAVVRVSHARTSGLVVLTVTSPDVVVGVRRARALVRAGDR